MKSCTTLSTMLLATAATWAAVDPGSAWPLLPQTENSMIMPVQMGMGGGMGGSGMAGKGSGGMAGAGMGGGGMAGSGMAGGSKGSAAGGMGGMGGATNVNTNRTNVNRTNVNRTTVNRTTNVRNVNVSGSVRPWVRQPYYGTIVGGVALGTMIAATTVPVAPAPNLCWIWTSSAHTQGYWDYCTPP